MDSPTDSRASNLTIVNVLARGKPGHTDPRLLDVAGALKALPELPLEGKLKLKTAFSVGRSA